MYQRRENEPEYALLSDRASQSHNRYGHPIETVPEGHNLRDISLNINGDSGIGENPNRYKQHGFYFNADNCIACHACENACSEKNDVPAHQAFRSVGFVEGGSYPDYHRINISLACNHCDDPVCLKGCPTRAYTKYAEYGAVLQDPDICFGCGYCTWVCPYNAPQLDPVKGQVSKCNMCVDRLEVGLKPACVSACLGKALDFGVVENIPAGRVQSKTEIPGLPRTDITHPNVRFQQTRETPREMRRVDAMPIKSHRDDQSGRFEALVDHKLASQRQWNWRKLLLSHESSHTIFTLCTQAVMGAFMLSLLALLVGLPGFEYTQSPAWQLPRLFALLAIIAFGLFKLNMHLGKPHRFYRGFNNLRHSPVSREIAGVSGFFASLAGATAFTLLAMLLPDQHWLVTLAAATALGGMLSGLAGLYYMVRLYLIPARPWWNHWQTGAAFAGSALSLGAALVGLFSLPFSTHPGTPGKLLAGVIAVALALELLALVMHRRDLENAGDEGAASLYLQRTRFGYPALVRNALLIFNLLATLTLSQTGVSGFAGTVLWVALFLSLLAGELIGRSLFYAVVIPTTMPGAFFWKNQGFVEHARESGLAKMPQLGVAYERHHSFNWRELLDIRSE